MSAEHSLTFREFPSLLADLMSTRDVLTEELRLVELHGIPEHVAAAKLDLEQCETALRIAVTELVKKADGVAAFIRSEEAGHFQIPELPPRPRHEPAPLHGSTALRDGE